MYRCSLTWQISSTTGTGSTVLFMDEETHVIDYGNSGLYLIDFQSIMSAIVSVWKF